MSQDRESPLPAAASDQTQTSLSPAGSILSTLSSRPAIPEKIGRYRIRRLVAQGGMGAIYEAEQENPSRIVALKVIKPGLVDEEAIRRFGQESYALGRLQHPGIAQIYEAGTAEGDSGAQPYLAMEFVEGFDLVTYAERYALSVPRRLELVAQICDAVHHAHQRGLIHRDLKPGNILVDRTGQPKVLDFGVARIVDAEGQMTQQTAIGRLIGTLAYMSPEQVIGDPFEIDTRSDIYALGVVLYELLAARLPYDLSRKGLPETVRLIREHEPSRLGTVCKAYRGDIEIIVTKALEKDKTRRYASAADLASDIRRYLNHEPIAARAPSTAYQFQKFARRHRAIVAGVTAVFVVLVAGIIASSAESIRAKRAELSARHAELQARAERDRAVAAELAVTKERDRAVMAEGSATLARNRAIAAEAQARRERDTAVLESRRADSEAANAKAVSDFLETDLLAQASAVGRGAGAKADPDVKVRTVLDRAAGRVAGRFSDKPKVEASIEATIGTTYWHLGLLSEAKQHLSRAMELDRGALGRNHPVTLAVAETLGETYTSAGSYGEAESLLRETVRAYVGGRGPDDPETLKAGGALAIVFLAEAKLDQAEPILSDLLERDRRVLGEDSETTLDTMDALARVYFLRGKLPDAERLLLQKIDGQKRALGPEHPYTVRSMNNLAVLYQRENKYREAESLYASVIDLQTRIDGPDHPETLNSLNNLGVLYSVEGKYIDAEPLYRKVMEQWRIQLGAEHPRTLAVMSNMAKLRQGEGKLGEAEAIGKNVLEVRARVLGAEHIDTLDSMRILGSVFESEGKYLDAEPLLSKVLELSRRVLGPKHPDTLDALTRLGELRIDQRRYAEAESFLRECLELQKQLMPTDYRRYWTEHLLGASLAGEQKYAEAEPLLTSGYEGMKKNQDTTPALNREKINKAGEQLLALYGAWGKPEKVREWQQRLQVGGKLRR